MTQVVWGLADFRHRFGREPESLWLPETACDNRTLDLLIEQQLRFVILAPNQAARVRAAGSEWTSVENGSIDTTKAYRYFHRDGSGRSIAVFFYDGPAARAIAFEKALVSSEALVAVFKRAAARGPLVNVATDGETYGHHFKFGDLCLAHTLEIEAPEEVSRLQTTASILIRTRQNSKCRLVKARIGRVRPGAVPTVLVVGSEIVVATPEENQVGTRPGVDRCGQL